MSGTHARHVHRYVGTAEWSGASSGMESYDAYSREWTFAIPGKPVVSGSADVPFRGDAALWNPEDLLLCALSTCHMLSWLALCARDGIIVTSYRDRAEGSMAFRDGKMRFVEVVLHPETTISAGSPNRAAELHEEAHASCFIASSVNFPVRHEARMNA